MSFLLHFYGLTGCCVVTVRNAGVQVDWTVWEFADGTNLEATRRFWGCSKDFFFFARPVGSSSSVNGFGCRFCPLKNSIYSE